MEVITPDIVADVRNAIAANDAKALSKYGRFLGSIADRFGSKDARVTALLDSAYKRVLNDVVSSCGHK